MIAPRSLLLTVSVLLAFSLSALAAPASVLADEPPGDDHADVEDIDLRGSPEEAALAAKLALAALVESYVATGFWDTAISAELLGPVSPNYECEYEPCEPPPPGGRPPSAKTLNTRPRRQINNYSCGPAAGQVVINWSRGIVVDDLNGGQNEATNWKTQSVIAGWMGTSSQSGTTGFQIKNGLNRTDAVRKPTADWAYHYKEAASGAEFHSWIVHDIAYYSMPVVPDLRPHDQGAQFFVPSWSAPANGAKHWIAIRGYNGFWDGTDGPKVSYSDSAGWDGDHWQPGNYTTGALTMWKVVKSLYGKVVW